MTHMTAIAIEDGKGPASALTPVQRPLPSPGPGEILIKVYAAGVNRPDLLQRMGFYPPPPGAPDILGLEAAGEVVGLGDGVRRWKLGDKVTAGQAVATLADPFGRVIATANAPISGQVTSLATTPIRDPGSLLVRILTWSDTEVCKADGCH